MIIMKKIICAVLFLLILTLTCSCGRGNNTSNESFYESKPTSVSETVSSSQPSETNVSSETVSEAVSSQISSQVQTSVESQPAVPSKPQVTSQVTSSVASNTSSVVSKPALPKLSYTVNDPQNTRGLSTARIGFSFGVAQNGVAHEQSFLNQKKFDELDGVTALALDTKTQGKVMYLTFDNGYEYKNLTGKILDTLKQKQVKAAFFVTLSYAKQNPNFIRRMINEGHIVGNHSATHPSFPSLNRTQMAEEIATLDNYLRETISYTSEYFRFPSGAYSDCGLELVSSIGFKSIFWSIAYADWDTSTQKGADYAFSTVTSRFHPGAVILLHAVSQDNADALGRIIDEAINQGYTFKTLPEYTY